MGSYRIRIFLSESNWVDSVIHADTWFNAERLARAQSPIGRVHYLGEA